MPRPVFFSILFIIAGVTAFALFAPLFVGDNTASAVRTASPFIALICGAAGIAMGLHAERKGWVLWSTRSILRIILYSAFFIFMGCLLFALLAPIFFRGKTAIAARVALPFIVIIFGALGISVGRSEHRGRAIRDAEPPRDKSMNPGSSNGMKESEERERTYDY